MAEMIRCKACGLVISAKLAGNVCPACGVPRTSFEPYTDRMSPARRWWLKHHIHGVSVHAPQAFTVFLFLLTVGAMVSGAYPAIEEHLLATARVLAAVLPLSVLVGFGTGVFDGKKRFKRLSPPFLRLKMIAGGVFFAAASLLSYLILTRGFTTPTVYGILAINAVAIVCGALLGKIGGMLHCAELGGK